MNGQGQHECAQVCAPSTHQTKPQTKPAACALETIASCVENRSDHGLVPVVGYRHRLGEVMQLWTVTPCTGRHFLARGGGLRWCRREGVACTAVRVLDLASLTLAPGW